MDAASAKKYILSLQNQNAGSYNNGVGYTVKTPNVQSLSAANFFSNERQKIQNITSLMNRAVSSGQITVQDAAADIMNYFYPYDIENQKIALGQLGLSDETINALIMANAG